GAQISRQPDQLRSDFGLIREIPIVDFYFIAVIALNAVEHLQSAAAARAFYCITGVGNDLQFFQDKAGHDNNSLEEIGFNQVGDPAINDDAGVEQQQIVGPVLRGETDIRNDEGEIF